jgi:pimeloyl-ACP methyl ester carboxylesterase
VHPAPRTRYTRSGEVNVAYQVIGDGPRDLVYVPGFASNIDVMWDDPDTARFLGTLASFSRLIIFDKRGTGMSDAVPIDRLPTLEERMDDVRAVMDAAGSKRATLMGHSEGGNMSILFSATYPDRCDGLILVSCYAKRIWSEDYPWAPTPSDREAEIAEIERNWGDPSRIPAWMAPSRKTDPAFVEWLARYFRLSASPKAAAHLVRMNTAIDTRAVLPSIRVPTLCIYRSDDADVKVDEGRWIASQIPDARFVDNRARTTTSLRATTTHSSPRSGSSSPATGLAPSPDECSRPSCSPTSSARPTTPCIAAITNGAISCSATTASSATRCCGFAAWRSTPPATASSRPSTVRLARSPRRGTCAPV